MLTAVRIISTSQWSHKHSFAPNLFLLMLAVRVTGGVGQRFGGDWSSFSPVSAQSPALQHTPLDSLHGASRK